MCNNLINFNYKPQTESQQKHLVLYIDRHLRPVAIMIEVTSRHMECTDFNLVYSQMPAVALQTCLEGQNKKLGAIAPHEPCGSEPDIS